MSEPYEPDTTDQVLCEVADERRAQDEKWGQQNHPDIDPRRPAERWRVLADEVRQVCQAAAADGTISWSHILSEEMYEAYAEAADGETFKLRAELIQVAAVATAWVEAIDRRASVTNAYSGDSDA